MGICTLSSSAAAPKEYARQKPQQVLSCTNTVCSHGVICWARDTLSGVRIFFFPSLCCTWFLSWCEALRGSRQTLLPVLSGFRCSCCCWSSFMPKEHLLGPGTSISCLYFISALPWQTICICSWTQTLSASAAHSLAAAVPWYHSSVSLCRGKLSFLIVSGQGEFFYHPIEMVPLLFCPGCFTEVAIPIAWEDGAETCADGLFDGCLLPHFHCWEKCWSMGPLCKVLLKKSKYIWGIFQRQQHRTRRGTRVVLAEELNSFSFISLFSKARSLLWKLVTMCWSCHSHHRHRLELAHTWLSCFVNCFVP